MEEFIDIKGYEGLYQISNLGRVKSLERTSKSRGHDIKLKERFLKYGNSAGDYLIVSLYLNKKGKSKHIHKLVAGAFIPAVDGKKEVNHKDGNKRNNNSSNLERCTRSENIKHAYDMGLKKPNNGEKHYKSKLTEEDVLSIRYSNEPRKLLSEKYNVNLSTIAYVINNKTWKHI